MSLHQSPRVWDLASHTRTCGGLLTAAGSGQPVCAMGRDRGAEGSRTQHTGTLERTGGESSRASRLLSWGSLHPPPVRSLQSVCRPHSVLRAPVGPFADVQSREQSAADAADVGRAPLRSTFLHLLSGGKTSFPWSTQVLFVPFFCVFSSLIVAKSI